MGDVPTYITALLTAMAALAGALGGPKLIDLLRDRLKIADAKDERDAKREDGDLSWLRGRIETLERSATAQQQQHTEEIRELRGKLDTMQTQLTETRVSLAEQRTAREADQKMYSQLVEAHAALKIERDELRVQLTALRNENQTLAAQLTQAREEVRVLKGLPAPKEGEPS